MELLLITILNLGLCELTRLFVSLVATAVRHESNAIGAGVCLSLVVPASSTASGA